MDKLSITLSFFSKIVVKPLEKKSKNYKQNKIKTGDLQIKRCAKLFCSTEYIFNKINKTTNGN